MSQLDGLAYRSGHSRLVKMARLGAEQVSVANQKLPLFISDGWTVVKSGKTRTLLQRSLPEYKSFELLVWYMCYLLGFEELSGMKGAGLIRAHGSTNQLDVVAVSSDVALIFECKCATSSSPRTFDANSESPKLSDNVNEVRRVLKERDNQNIKVKGVFCLSGIRPSKADRKRANDCNQKILDEATVRYYIDLAERIGPAAYFQFLGEVIGGDEIPSMRDIRIPCVKTRIGATAAYQLALTPDLLLRIAYVAHRSASATDGYQRMITKSRLASMRQFIDQDGYFPTNIVINFRSDGAKPVFEAASMDYAGPGESKMGMLRIPAAFGCAWVIDGQHRLLSYAGHKWAKTSTLPVTAFDGLERSKEAELFEEINSKQKKVSAALLAELFASLHMNNPDAKYQVKAMASATVDRMKHAKGGPLYGKIIGADERSSEFRCITVKSFMDALCKPGFFYWRLNGSKLQQGGPFWLGDPFESVARAEEILSYWFDSVKQGASDEWEAGEPGLVATNRGISACLRVLYNVFQRLRREDPDFDTRSEAEIADAIAPFGLICGNAFHDLRQTDFELARTTYGSSAVPHYHYTIVRYIKKEGWQDFEADGYDQWVADKESVNVQEAMALVTEMERAIQKTIKSMLERAHDGDPWKQLPSDIRAAAAALRESKDGTDDQWNYLQLIDYRKIVQNHWQLFQGMFGRMPGKDKGTQWMVELNSIRSDAFHAAGNRLGLTQIESLRSIRVEMVESGIIQSGSGPSS